MENLLDFGIQIIVYLQGLGEWLVPVMGFFTFLGVEDFYLIVLPAIYWCFNRSFGLRLALIVMLSGSFNDSAKIAFHTPRPFWYSRNVLAHAHEYQFGVPSGHAQNAVAFWGYWAKEVKKLWYWIVVIGLILVIGFSRLVLGMHFYFDVIIGWLIGILFLWIFVRLEPRISAWMENQTLALQVAAAFIASLALIGLVALSIAALGGWQIPPTWIENAKAALTEEPASPISFRGIVSKAGVFFGLGLGAAIIAARGGFSVAGSARQKILRYILGLIGAVIFWVGLDLVFPDGDTFVPLVFRYVRYGLTGFWVAGGAPLLFKRLRLVSTQQSPV